MLHGYCCSNCNASPDINFYQQARFKALCQGFHMVSFDRLEESDYISGLSDNQVFNLPLVRAKDYLYPSTRSSFHGIPRPYS